MATNFVQQGDHLVVAKASMDSGDPTVIGTIPGVCLTDTEGDGNVVLATAGVYDLAVHGEDGSGDSAVAIGDIVYYDTDEVNVDDANGVRFGYALEVVASGATTTIQVAIGY